MEVHIMHTCPECHAEYEDADGKCPQCGMEKWVELTNVANEIEVSLIAGLLELAGIPIVHRILGVDPILAGVAMSGIDILVPESRYQEALELLNSNAEEGEEGVESRE
jgi:RNA polymerase subunit RPABC4/transcription elongation factor Spt4